MNRPPRDPHTLSLIGGRAPGPLRGLPVEVEEAVMRARAAGNDSLFQHPAEAGDWVLAITRPPALARRDARLPFVAALVPVLARHDRGWFAFIEHSPLKLTADGMFATSPAWLPVGKPGMAPDGASGQALLVARHARTARGTGTLTLERLDHLLPETLVAYLPDGWAKHTDLPVIEQIEKDRADAAGQVRA